MAISRISNRRISKDINGNPFVYTVKSKGKWENGIWVEEKEFKNERFGILTNCFDKLKAEFAAKVSGPQKAL